MTQPPDQPPHQDGFGAPQDQPPRAPGFGPPEPPAQPPQAPQPPPGPGPAAGYGYPQQPGAPAPGGPAPAGPYGTPPAPGPYNAPPTPPAPGPYAAPQQAGPYGPPQQPGPYGQQPGYGYPQAAQYPGGPGAPGMPGAPGSAPGGSRNPFKGRPALVVAAAVVGLVLVGGTVFAVTRGGDDDGKKPVAEKSDDGKPSASDLPVNPGDGSGDGGDPENFNDGRKAGEARVLWYKEAPDAPGSGAEAPGMWVTDKTAVKAAYKELVGYNVADGKPTWETLTFPQEICAVTPQKTADDKIVIAYMSGTSSRAECNKLQQVDLNTGAKGWTAEVADGALFDSTSSISLSVTGNTLMVGRSQSGTAYDVRTGKKLYDKKRYGSACFPDGFAGGSRLIVVSSCDATKATEHDEMQELDPASGKVKWTWKIDKGWEVQHTFSVDPLVVLSTNDEKNSWNISTLNPNGTIRSQVGVNEQFAPDCGGWGSFLQRDLTGCTGAVADAGTLYLPTKATTGPNEVVAIDLANGKEKWRVDSPGDATMLPLKVEGGNLVSYVEATYEAPGQVVSVPIAGSGHTPAKLLQLPESTSEIERDFFRRDLDWADGRFYISTGSLDGDDDEKEKLMLAYGK
ncbi:MULTISPECIES: PQQ-binding-like beta-propeller repeat protein [unclassified Streptomyces]|uniref:outer membrane protein assembly factor BamB family protein n=1 Tax=unclassified Streptomyces TaxID=2593676 RepID=UPI003D735674